MHRSRGQVHRTRGRTMAEWDLIRCAAHNLAGWHDASVRALGLSTATTEHWWTTPRTAPAIYHSAISLERGARDHTAIGELGHLLRSIKATWVSVCDSFATLDLGRLGLQRVGTAPWYARLPGQLTAPSRPAGLVVRRIANQEELRQFERAIAIAFGLPFSVDPFALHGPAILDDPAMHVLAGWCDGHLVSTSMAYEAAGVLGVYGIGTLPGFRGRGFARAMTETAIAIRPELPVTLQPTQAAAPLYRALGFTPIGTYALWRR